MSLRSQFKKTKLTTLQKPDNNLSNSNYQKRNYLNLEVGDNIFRIFPAWGDGDRYYEQSTRSSVPKKWTNREGKTFEGNKKVFNARQHGGLSMDIVEEYIKIVEDISSIKVDNGEIADADALRHYMNPINGFRTSKGGKEFFQFGIRPTTRFMIYALRLEKHPNGGLVEVGDIGLLEVGKYVKDEMTSFAKTTSTEDNEYEPYSDVSEGVPVIITKNPHRKGMKSTEYYDLKFYTHMVEGVRFPVPCSYPLSDNLLEEALKLDPLEKVYGTNSYTKKDFESALEGLKLFDEKNNYGVFDDSNFLDIAEKISAELDAKEPKAVETPPVAVVETPPVAVETPPVEPVDNDDLIEDDDLPF
jgi:hypothetical protein